jgi:hypothetical protein
MLISSPRIPTPISATISIIAFVYGGIMVLYSTGTKSMGRW